MRSLKLITSIALLSLILPLYAYPREGEHEPHPIICHRDAEINRCAADNLVWKNQDQEAINSANNSMERSLSLYNEEDRAKSIWITAMKSYEISLANINTEIEWDQLWSSNPNVSPLKEGQLIYFFAKSEEISNLSPFLSYFFSDIDTSFSHSSRYTEERNSLRAATDQIKKSFTELQNNIQESERKLQSFLNEIKLFEQKRNQSIASYNLHASMDIRGCREMICPSN